MFLAPERLSDRHNLAWGHRLQSDKDGLYKWQQVFKESAKSRNKRYLIKRIAYRIQELADGGLYRGSQDALHERLQRLAAIAGELATR